MAYYLHPNFVRFLIWPKMKEGERILLKSKIPFVLAVLDFPNRSKVCFIFITSKFLIYCVIKGNLLKNRKVKKKFKDRAFQKCKIIHTENCCKLNIAVKHVCGPLYKFLFLYVAVLDGEPKKIARKILPHLTLSSSAPLM